MTSLNNEDVASAWKALSGSYQDDGWRSIPIIKLENCTILAARKFPGNDEAILLGFTSVKVQPSNLLPQSKGFKIESPSLTSGNSDQQDWLSLVRQQRGDLGLFSQMASDVISTLASSPDQHGEILYKLFLKRVIAWQEFMRKSQACLSAAEELGLIGELEVIRLLLEKDLSPHLIIDSWKGPIDGIQDFELGSGALEVKSTLSKEGFSAQILSLNQLDDSVVSPIFLFGCLFTLDSNGLSLPQKVRIIRENLDDNRAALELFNNGLLRAGYLDSHEEDYSRSFASEMIKIWIVDDLFPRLIPSNVPMGVRQVRYEIDLSGLDDHLVSIEKVLKSVEVM